MSSVINPTAPTTTTIILLKDCAMRVQRPAPTAKGDKAAAAAAFEAAKVTALTWNQTPTGVTTTINDFYDHNGNNLQLWLDGGVSGMVYAGMYASEFIGIVPQTSLNDDQNCVSVILPSGMAKLNLVSGIPANMVPKSREALAIIHGIALKDPAVPLVPQDYVYFDMKHMKDTIADHKKNGPKRAPYGIPLRSNPLVLLQFEEPV